LIDTDNKDKVELIDMNKRNLEQELFNRLSISNKLEILEFISDSKHKIILDMELI